MERHAEHWTAQSRCVQGMCTHAGLHAALCCDLQQLPLDKGRQQGGQLTSHAPVRCSRLCPRCVKNGGIATRWTTPCSPGIAPPRCHRGSALSRGQRQGEHMLI